MEIIIKSNRSVFKIYNADSFIELPLKNVRKLWKLMFDEAWRNEESIQNLKQWLPNICAQFGVEMSVNESAFAQASQNAETLRREAAAFGSHKSGAQARKAAQKARGEARSAEARLKQSVRNAERAGKLQRIFAELSP